MSNQGASLLEIERDRVQRALGHLERSVTELKAAVAETGPDLEYKTAINENVVLIAKYRARIAALDDEIKQSKGIRGDISMSQVAAVPLDDSDIDMQQQAQQQQQHLQLQGESPTAGTTAMEEDSGQPPAAAAAAAAATPGAPAQQGGVWL